MCGISGFYQTKFNYTKDPLWAVKLIKMKDSLLRRGPDDNGLWLSNHCGLAHSRLSIIDPVGGHQPMEKERCCISYNGELYNTKEIKARLRPYPLTWETDSDTEVILNAYLALGADCLSELNGIFAFAIYDSRLDHLLLARDHLGVKPLFYQWANDSFLFGSEPKALFAFGIRPRLNEESFGEVFGLGPARTPGHGLFADMKEVLPGHYLLIKDSNLQDRTYWQLTAVPHTDSYAQTVEKVSDLVSDSVIRQMVSDVPICSFLSGGLDSSLISAIASRHLNERGGDLSTFSFDFCGNDKNFRPNDFQSSLDRPFVDIMAAHIGSSHSYLECDSLHQADGLLDAVVARDLPCMADVESSLLYFSSLVSKSHHVALTGECADEIFGGYPWFHRENLLAKNHFPWSYDMQPRLALLRDDFLAKHHIADYAQSAYESSLAQTPRLAGENPTEARRREIAWLNVRWFMATLLNRTDRTSMYCGLEARVPYADYRILEYVFNVPWEMKCKNGQTKSLLIEAAKGYLPPEILYRKKSPYPKTYDVGYEKLLSTRLKIMLEQKDAPILQIVDKQKVLDFLESKKDYGRPWYGQLMAGPQMIAYLLQIDYWMERYRISV
ncbi:asparagine synthetase B [Clostridia bacterium]|nr:asparagine synthetase B [Clostridia bacterium]